jgi:hypothetical protein
MLMNHSKMLIKIFYQLCHEPEITLILKVMPVEQIKVGKLRELAVEEPALVKRKSKVAE